ncbi:pectate lyase-like adhesive domain-containing protein, partial [Enterococcus faecium]|uniref:pectate lyase-like adhesive domain-containing protein n=1 Tax=Enterococcus faecium TaxID=1352 RepID=UPI0039FD5F64
EADKAVEEAALLDVQQQETNESAAVELLSERATQGERAEVSNYQELRAAFSNSMISEIVFLADITADYMNEANNRLAALNRSVSIDGNGFTLT